MHHRPIKICCRKLFVHRPLNYFRINNVFMVYQPGRYFFLKCMFLQTSSLTFIWSNSYFRRNATEEYSQKLKFSTTWLIARENINNNQHPENLKSYTLGLLKFSSLVILLIRVSCWQLLQIMLQKVIFMVHFHNEAIILH